MTTTLMESAATRPSKSVARPERSVREIITKGRAAPAGGRGAWGLSLLTAALSWAMFTPLDWGWLGWVALVPVLVLCRIRRKTKWMYTALTVSSFLGWLATLQWMRLGDATMYPAWAALALYIALYMPLFVSLTRGAV
ncbi:MAG: apolipoprotein N-acyltransferase, partial [Planctomycetaceae bacterium]